MKSSEKFNSIQSMAHFIRVTAETAGAGNAAYDTESYMCYGGLTFDAALELAEKGGIYTEGAVALQTVTLPETQIRTPRPRRKQSRGVAGFAPDVPRYLSGAPDCMLDRVRSTHPAKLLKIGVHVGKHAKATAECVLNRGRAIMSAVDALTLQGYSIEVWAVWRNDDDGDHNINIDTCIKPYTAPWQPSLVAFALTHMAFQRRLCWAVAQKTATGGVFNHNYGSGVDVDMSDFNISFRYLTRGDSGYATPAKALKTVQRDIANQLTTGACKQRGTLV